MLSILNFVVATFQRYFVICYFTALSSTTEIPPVIVVPPSPTTVIEGSDSAAVLECVANARYVTYFPVHSMYVSLSS